MNQKEILTIGMLATFALAAIMDVKPAVGQDQDSQVTAEDIVNGNEDNDSVEQSNSADPWQSTAAGGIVSGLGNTITAQSTQSSTATQSNTNTDNDVLSNSAASSDNIQGEP